MTEIRAVLSKKNQYALPKHRYYELKHFCLQYPDWKRARVTTDISVQGIQYRERVDEEQKDWVAEIATVMAEYNRKIKLVEETARQTDSILWPYILMGVTEGVGYTYLSTVLKMPCSKEYYYKLYRKFFYLLNSQE